FGCCVGGWSRNCGDGRRRPTGLAWYESVGSGEARGSGDLHSGGRVAEDRVGGADVCGSADCSSGCAVGSAGGEDRLFGGEGGDVAGGGGDHSVEVLEGDCVFACVACEASGVDHDY